VKQWAPYATFSFSKEVFSKVPQRVVCSKCKAVLYESYEVIEPVDILSRYNSMCPNCGKRLEFDIDRVKISLFNPKVVEAV